MSWAGLLATNKCSSWRDVSIFVKKNTSKTKTRKKSYWTLKKCVRIQEMIVRIIKTLRKRELNNASACLLQCPAMKHTLVKTNNIKLWLEIICNYSNANEMK